MYLPGTTFAVESVAHAPILAGCLNVQVKTQPVGVLVASGRARGLDVLHESVVQCHAKPRFVGISFSEISKYQQK